MNRKVSQMYIIDPIDLDPTKIRVPLPLKNGKIQYGTEIVDAVQIEKICPHCCGTGKIKVKVPKKNMKEK